MFRKESKWTLFYVVKKGKYHQPGGCLLYIYSFELGIPCTNTSNP